MTAAQWPGIGPGFPAPPPQPTGGGGGAGTVTATTYNLETWPHVEASTYHDALTVTPEAGTYLIGGAAGFTNESTGDLNVDVAIMANGTLGLAQCQVNAKNLNDSYEGLLVSAIIAPVAITTDGSTAYTLRTWANQNHQLMGTDATFGNSTYLTLLKLA